MLNDQSECQHFDEHFCIQIAIAFESQLRGGSVFAQHCTFLMKKKIYVCFCREIAKRQKNSLIQSIESSIEHQEIMASMMFNSAWKWPIPWNNIHNGWTNKENVRIRMFPFVLFQRPKSHFAQCTSNHHHYFWSVESFINDVASSNEILLSIKLAKFHMNAHSKWANISYDHWGL